jgi:hypothetical protein
MPAIPERQSVIAGAAPNLTDILGVRKHHLLIKVPTRVPDPNNAKGGGLEKLCPASRGALSVPYSALICDRHLSSVRRIKCTKEFDGLLINELDAQDDRTEPIIDHELASVIGPLSVTNVHLNQVEFIVGDSCHEPPGLVPNVCVNKQAIRAYYGGDNRCSLQRQNPDRPHVGEKCSNLRAKQDEHCLGQINIEPIAVRRLQSQALCVVALIGWALSGPRRQPSMGWRFGRWNGADHDVYHEDRYEYRDYSGPSSQ